MQNALKYILVAVTYYLLGQWGLSFAYSYKLASPIWPASGAAFALVYLLGPKYIYSVFAASLALNAPTCNHPLNAALIAIGTSLEILVAYQICKRIKVGQLFRRFSSDGFVLLIGAAAGSMIAGTLGAFALYFDNAIAWENYSGAWITWWLGDLVGIAIITPIILAVAGNIKEKFALKHFVFALFRAVLAMSISSVIAYEIFTDTQAYSLVFLIFPVIGLVVGLTSNLVARSATLAIALIAIHCTTIGLGPFMGEGPASGLLILQFFLIALIATELLIEELKVQGTLLVSFPIFMFGWILSGLLFHSSFEQIKLKNNVDWIETINRLDGTIRSSLASYSLTLRNAAGFVAASENIKRDEWRTYVNALDISNTFPGVVGLGLIKRVPNQEVNLFVAKQKRDGAPNFTVRTLQDNSISPLPFRSIITFIEPMDRNSMVEGLDITTESSRREAVLTAMRSGKVTITSRIELLQDNTIQSGFLLLQPFYKKGTTSLNSLEREKNLEGWVYVPIILETVFKNFMGPDWNKFGVAVLSGAKRDRDSIVFASPKINDVQSLLMNPENYYVREIEFAQKKFSVFWHRDFNQYGDGVLAVAWQGATSALLTLAAGWAFAFMLTLRRQVENIVDIQTQEIMTREQTWRSFTAASPVGVFKTDPDGSCSYVNPKWEQITGLDFSKAQGYGWTKAIHPDDAELVKSKWQQSVDEKRPFQMEFRFLRPDGSVCWVESVADRIVDAQGRTTGYIGVDVDISDKKAQTETIERERTKMIESAKMASLGEMAGGMAHEINNPLAIILGNITIVKLMINKHHFDEKVLSERVQAIEVTTKRIHSIVKALLHFSRKSGSEVSTDTEVVSVINETLEFCKEKFAQKGIELLISGDTGSRIFCMRVQMVQVFLNLLNNAHDAIKDSHNPWIKIMVENQNSSIKISFEDSGNGIDPAIADKIMIPFFTTKDAGKGTGLGLSLSKQIVESHGGKLFYDANAKNTRFVIELPTAQNQKIAA